MTATPTAKLPTCCEHRGLFYPDGGKRCFRHFTDADKQLVAQLDKQAKPILGTKGWPYGPNVDVAARQRLTNWAEHYNLKLAKTSCQEMHWLTKGRCGVQVCQRMGSWMDHVTRWSRGGKPALVLAQPYQIMADDMVQLGSLATTDSLDVHVQAHGWYGHGTVAVEVWRADVYRDFLSAPR